MSFCSVHVFNDFIMLSFLLLKKYIQTPRLVTDSREWSFLRKSVSPCYGYLGPAFPIQAKSSSSVEHDMLSDDGQITLRPKEILYIPFVFISFASGPVIPKSQTQPQTESSWPWESTTHAINEKIISVSFSSTTYGQTTTVLQVSTLEY